MFSKTPMKSMRKWAFFWILIPILLVGVLGFLLIYSLRNPDLYQRVLQDFLTQAFGREVSIGKTHITLSQGLGISVEDFRIKDRSGRFDLMKSQRVLVKVKLLPLLRREFRWKALLLDQPTLHLIRYSNGQINLFDGAMGKDTFHLRAGKIFPVSHGGSIIFRNGELTFTDEGSGELQRVTLIKPFHLQISITPHRSVLFRLRGKVFHSQKEGLFNISGSLQDIPENGDLLRGRIHGVVNLQGMEISHFWPYLKKLLPMKAITGTLDLKGNYQGDLSGAFKSSLQIHIKNLHLDYPQVFSDLLKPKWVAIGLEVDFDLKEILIPKLSIDLPEIKVKGKGRIYGIGTKGMGIEAEAESSPFELSEGKKFIPFGIITPEVSQTLFRAEGNGPVQIISVKLSGKIPEIDHCDERENAHVLSVEMDMKKVRLKLPWDLPELEDLSGHLIFKDGHLLVKGVKGRVFHSNIGQASGTFYNLLLTPSVQIQAEGGIDLRDLPSFLKTGGFLNGSSNLLSSLEIQAGRASYRLNLQGLLKPPLHFQHQGTYQFSNLRLNHPNLPLPVLIREGRVELSNGSLRWSGVRGNIEHFSFITEGSWREMEGSKPFEVALKGGGDLSPLFSLSRLLPDSKPIFERIKWIEKISGKGEVSLKIFSSKGLKNLSYEGEVWPKGLSLQVKGTPSPLVFKEGTFSFSNLGYHFSKLNVQHRDSTITLEGSLKDKNLDLVTMGSVNLSQLLTLLRSAPLSGPMRSELGKIQELTGSAELDLKWLGRVDDLAESVREGKIRLKEVRFHHQKIPIPLKLIKGMLSFSPQTIRFDELQGILGDSPVLFSGEISRPSSKKSPYQKIRRLSFQAFSSYLDLDLLFPKREQKEPVSFIGLSQWLSHWSIEGRIMIEQGRFRGVTYHELKGEFKSENGRLSFRPFQFRAEGGDFWSAGWIQPIEKGIKFEIKPQISHIEAGPFLQTVLQKEGDERVFLTGKIHMDKVELRGEGENLQQIKETLQGNLRFELEEGVIEKFNILSKIFSILNVSQLLKGKLPDLKTKGLPYNQISGTLSVKDGIASTEDFLIDSDAMKITIIGEVDLGKNLINARIGVHPLVTIDMVLSSLPIAGYILTGRDKAFLSYIYEVKGDLDDPKIEAVPLKSLGETFWGIIKRLMETPLRPFKKRPNSKK